MCIFIPLSGNGLNKSIAPCLTSEKFRKRSFLRPSGRRVTQPPQGISLAGVKKKTPLGEEHHEKAGNLFWAACPKENQEKLPVWLRPGGEAGPAKGDH